MIRASKARRNIRKGRSAGASLLSSSELIRQAEKYDDSVSPAYQDSFAERQKLCTAMSKIRSAMVNQIMEEKRRDLLASRCVVRSPNDAKAREKAIAQLSEEEVERFRKIFTHVDSSGDGVISAKEMVLCVAKLGMATDPESVSRLLDEMDAGGNGTISFDEFIGSLALRITNPFDENAVRHAFFLFDENNDGKMSISDLEYAMKELTLKPMEEEDFTRMVRELDKNGDGFILCDDFVKLLASG